MEIFISTSVYRHTVSANILKKRSEPFSHFCLTLVWTHSINMLPKQVAHINQASLHMQLFIARSKLYNWGRKVIECYTNSPKRNASGTSLDYWIETGSFFISKLICRPYCQFYSSNQKAIVVHTLHFNKDYNFTKTLWGQPL